MFLEIGYTTKSLTLEGLDLELQAEMCAGGYVNFGNPLSRCRFRLCQGYVKHGVPL